MVLAAIVLKICHTGADQKHQTRDKAPPYKIALSVVACPAAEFETTVTPGSAGSATEFRRSANGPEQSKRRGVDNVRYKWAGVLGGPGPLIRDLEVGT